MLPLSVIFWVLFEFYNFHLINWRYEGLPHLHWERIIGSTAAFATVLPGVLLTSEWLDAKGVFRNLKIEPLRVNGRLTFGLILFGTICAVVPLIAAAGVGEIRLRACLDRVCIHAGPDQPRERSALPAR